MILFLREASIYEEFKGQVLDMSKNQFLDYWNNNFPWSFRGEKTPYEERRRLRYQLHDYMHNAIGFGNYEHKLVLEVGCGGGIDSAEFAKNGADVVSLDFTSEGTRSTRDTLREAGQVPNVVRASAEYLPFRSDSFDCVYSFGVLHHIPAVDTVIEEITQILKPCADFICMVYNRESLLYAYSILFLHRNELAREDELLSRYSERNFGCPFTRAYTADEVRELLSEKFDLLEAQVYFDVIDTLAARKTKIKIEGQSNLGWHIIVKGIGKK